MAHRRVLSCHAYATIPYTPIIYRRLRNNVDYLSIFLSGRWAEEVQGDPKLGTSKKFTIIPIYIQNIQKTSATKDEERFSKQTF